jgi:hypothetical protein
MPKWCATNRLFSTSEIEDDVLREKEKWGEQMQSEVQMSHPN